MIFLAFPLNVTEAIYCHYVDPSLHVRLAPFTIWPGLGATKGAGTAYPSGAHEFTACF